MFKKCLLVLVFMFFVLPVCAGTREFMEKALNSWVGYNINDVISSWGFPTEEKTIANRHIYTWNRAWSQYVPQQTHTTFNPNYFNPTANSYTTGGYSVNYYCNKTIEVDDKNNVISWSWEGNACPSGYYYGKKLVNPANDDWEREKLRKAEIKRQNKLLKQQKKEQKQLEKLQKKESKKIKKKTKAKIKQKEG